ncbi:MAG: choice-of-anchor D domain-containing protein [Terriglobales bacterium]
MASRKTGSKPAAGAAGGGSSAGGGSASSSGGSTAPRPPAAGELAVSPKTLDFGKVTVGTTKGLTGALTAGNATITVKSAAWSGEGYSVSGIVFPATIPAGQSAHFKVIFAPQAAGTSSGGIKFSSNATHSTQAAFSGQGTRTPAHSVTLSWHSSSASVAGYNVYRGVNSKGPYTKITGSLHPKSTFTDASVVGGVTYYYMTTAVNKKGKESKYSNQVRVMIPNS